MQSASAENVFKWDVDKYALSSAEFSTYSKVLTYIKKSVTKVNFIYVSIFVECATRWTYIHKTGHWDKIAIAFNHENSLSGAN